MIRFFLRRIGQSIIVLLIVTIMVFLVMHAMPGDPVAMFLGPSASNEQIAFYTTEFGLDQPLYVQYYKWIAGLFRGEMGKSITYDQNINEMLGERIKVTLSIAIPAFLIASILGITLGIIAAVNRGTGIDALISGIANLGVAMPAFWIAILCVFLFSLKLRWLPVQGYTPLNEDFVLGLRKMILPVFVLSLGPLVSFTRQTRSAMLEVIRQDYIRTARSKGLKEQVVIRKHALRNAFIPILTLMGMAIGGLIGGSVIIEQIFVIPGVGTMMITAIFNKDYLIVQNVVLIVAISIMLCNLMVDFLYGYIDPRIRVE
jgi:peptide/nickel transport system permease protein